MIPLILDDTVRARIVDVKAYAARNVTTLEDTKKAVETGNAIGDDTNFVVDIPLAYRVVYSLEEHPGGMFHHLSMSVNAKGRSPNIQAVQLLLDEFGINAKIGDKSAVIWMEQGSIVNVLAPVNSASQLPTASTESTSAPP